MNRPWPDLTLPAREPDARQPYSPDALQARLVVEVAHPTADFETGPKRAAYQAAGVPEYWVVDVPGRRVLCHLAPDYQAETFAAGLLSPQAYPDVAAMFA